MKRRPENRKENLMDSEMSLVKTVDEQYMRLALEEARKAYDLGEVPIGAVVVRRGKVIARAHNLRETQKCAAAHAELLAIQQACAVAGGWRLTDTTLYVTVEPCPMCAGAILQARIERMVFGAHDVKGGACGSVLNILQDDRFNHQVMVQAGVLEEDCAEIMKRFFARLRGRQRQKTGNI
jgi:tRNA(adenine34) deaminase